MTVKERRNRRKIIKQLKLLIIKQEQCVRDMLYLHKLNAIFKHPLKDELLESKIVGKWINTHPQLNEIKDWTVNMGRKLKEQTWIQKKLK
jgi:hypothetical protein